MAQQEESEELNERQVKQRGEKELEMKERTILE